MSAEQQEQLAQLLQQSDDDEPPKPAAVQPVFGDVPAARPGLPMGTVDPQQATVGIPTGAFGSTTSVPETTGTRTITTRQP